MGHRRCGVFDSIPELGVGGETSLLPQFLGAELRLRCGALMQSLRLDPDLSRLPVLPFQIFDECLLVCECR